MFVKNLAEVEPDLSRVFIIDNSPVAYSLNPGKAIRIFTFMALTLVTPENAVPIEGWMNDRYDECLLDLLPFLDALRYTEDIRSVLSLRSL